MSNESCRVALTKDELLRILHGRSVDSFLDRYDLFSLCDLFRDWEVAGNLRRSFTEMGFPPPENSDIRSGCGEFAITRPPSSTTPPPLIEWTTDLITAHLDTSPTHVNLLAQRHLNAVLKAVVGCKIYLVKVCWNVPRRQHEVPGISFVKETRLLLDARTIGVPVPIVRATGWFRGLNYIIMDELPGLPVSNVFWTLGDEERVSLISQLMEIVGRLHRIRLESAGLIHDTGISNPFGRTTLDYLRGRIRALERIANPRLLKCLRLLQTIAGSLPHASSDPRLLHYDLGVRSGNILVSRLDGSWKVTGIVDFERAQSGDPREELALLEIELWKSLLREALTDLLHDRCPDSTLETGTRTLEMLTWPPDHTGHLEVYTLYRYMAAIIPGRWRFYLGGDDI